MCCFCYIYFSQFSRKLARCIQLGIVIIGTTNLVYIFFNFEMDWLINVHMIFIKKTSGIIIDVFFCFIHWPVIYIDCVNQYHFDLGIHVVNFLETWQHAYMYKDVCTWPEPHIHIYWPINHLADRSCTPLIYRTY
jgi:hypothetical protein